LAFLPPLDPQNATEPNGVARNIVYTATLNTAKLHRHLRRQRGVAISELDHVVTPAFQSFLPIRLLVAILDALGSSSDLRKKFPVQVEMKCR
jgi:hypothetical protein